MDDDITLSTTELQVISELDSQLFGFVKLNEEQHAKKKAIAKKAIQYLERVVVQAHLQESKRKDEQKEGRQGFVVDPKTYVKLGHLHLPPSADKLHLPVRRHPLLRVLRLHLAGRVQVGDDGGYTQPPGYHIKLH